jgi:hypothetical protein
MSWSQDHQGRISGENPGQNEHDHESTEDGRDSREDAAKDVLPEAHAMDKHQQPSAKSQIISNDQEAKFETKRLEVLFLKLGVYLEFGAWDLEF